MSAWKSALQPYRRYPVFWVQIFLSLAACLIFGWILLRNASIPTFVSESLGALYGDGYYIASVAQNIANGHGVSYWTGISYRFLDPEISTGPVVFLPLAAALYAGMDERLAFCLVPVIVNVTLLFLIMLRISSTVPSVRLFFAWVCALSVFSLCFQRWQWYLPLGEVPASLLLVLAILSLYGVWNEMLPRKKVLGRFMLCGALWAMASLSKMLVLITAPAFLYAFWGVKYWRGALLAALAGIAAVFLMAVAVIAILSPDISLQVLLESLYGYIVFNFNFGIADWFSVRSDAGKSLLDNILFYARESFSRISAIGDAKGYGKAGIVLMLCFVALAIGIFFDSSKARFFYILKGVLLILCGWYFLSGQHDSRYFFVVGYVGVCFMTIFLVWLDVEKSRLIIVFTAGSIIFFLFGRGVFLKREGDFVSMEAAEDVANFIEANNIDHVLSSSTLFHGYPKIAYHLDDSRYFSPVGYLIEKADLISPEGCISSKWSMDYTLPSPLNNSLIRCLMSETQWSSKIIFRWKNNNPGYFLKKIMRWEVDSYKPDCSTILYADKRYILMRCSKADLEKIINRELEGKVVVGF